MNEFLIPAILTAASSIGSVAVYVFRSWLSRGQEREVTVEVSGIDGTYDLVVRDRGARYTAEMIAKAIGQDELLDQKRDVDLA